VLRVTRIFVAIPFGHENEIALFESVHELYKALRLVFAENLVN